MHQRSYKSSHLDTILYEIDMLRHCSKTLAAKKARAPESDEAQAEYNLVIEGFLIHLRNLLAFFTTLHSPRDGDLRLDTPEVWLEKPLEEKEYADLKDQAQALNDGYGVEFDGAKKLDCYDLISKFLQHCTRQRFEHALSWDIEKMAREIELVLTDFEKRFAPVTTAVAIGLRDASCSTATVRKSVVFVSKEE